jgi:hypothetical protein
MKSVSIQGNGIEICKSVCENWNECSTEQIESLCCILWSSLDFAQIQLHCLSVLMDLSANDLVAIWENTENPESVAYGLLALTDFLFETSKEGQKMISTGLTKNPYPFIEMDKIVYPCADSSLDNVTFGEMTMLFNTYMAYTQVSTPGEKKQYKNLLLSILHRPHKPKTLENIEKGYEGDKRQPLQGYESVIDARAEILGGFDELKSDVIVFWCACCLNKVRKENDVLFSDAGEQDALGFAGVLLRLGGILGAEKVASLGADWVFMHLRQLDADAKEAEIIRQIN